MTPAGIVIFAATYLVISARRLSWLGFDRPAGALTGAVACVLAGVLTPAEALAAVDGATLLLLGVMGMGAFLAVDGFFDRVEGRVIAANIIVAEAARDVGGIGFWPYLRVGLPLALATTAVGTLWLMLAAG